MAYQGVFFDLYGTMLIYGDMAAAWADWLAALHVGLAARGLSMPKNELARYCDGFFTNPAPPRQDNLTVFEGRVRQLSIDLGLTLGQEDFCYLAQSSVDAWQHYVCLDPDTIPTLQTLRGQKKLALVSNFEHPAHVHALLARLGLADFFDAIVVSGDVGVEKPDPRIFAPALAQTHLRPGDALYVGDSPDDVRGAQAAGLTPVLIRRSDVDQLSVASNYKTTYDDLPSPAPAAKAAHTIRRLAEVVPLAG